MADIDAEMDEANERMGAEIVRLRAQIAEVEAERDAYKYDYVMTSMENGQLQETMFAAIEQRDAAETRLAEVEAERHRLMKLISVRESEWDATKARLAKVVRVRDWMAANNDDAAYDLAIVALNEALGEGDRPAEWDEHDGASSVAIAMSDPEYVALLKDRARDRPHPFHMSSYVGAEPRCWCDRYASDPIHGGEGDRPAEARPLVLGEPCPYDGGEVIDGGPAGLGCANGFRCKQPSPFSGEGDRPASAAQVAEWYRDNPMGYTPPGGGDRPTGHGFSNWRSDDDRCDVLVPHPSGIPQPCARPVDHPIHGGEGDRD